MKPVEFKQYNCELEINKYSSNNRTAITLIEVTSKDVVAVATTNLVNEKIEEDEVIIKSYSENEGMYHALLEAGVISPFVREIKTGWVTFQVCKLLI